MRYQDDLTDPVPEDKKDLKKYEVTERLNIQIDSPDAKSSEFISNI